MGRDNLTPIIGLNVTSSLSESMVPTRIDETTPVKLSDHNLLSKELEHS